MHGVCSRKRSGGNVLRFGTLGTANITPRALIYPCVDEPRAMVQAIAARDRVRAQSFARWARIPDVVDDYEAVIAHPRCNAIYVPLPITAHREWSISALRAGKHVLCEKSFAANAREAEDMALVAQETGLVLMDAFHYRYHPVFFRAKEIVDSGELGAVERIDAAFHIPVPPSRGKDIRLDYATGGGVTMDIGCYPISWVRHLTGEEPHHVTARAEVGPQHVDLMLEADFEFPSGIRARISGDMRPNTRFRADFEVTGDKGSLKVTNPLVPQNGHLIEIRIGDRVVEETRDRRPTYGYQLDAFIAAVKNGAPLLTGPDDAVKQMRLIDRCYQAAGLPIRGLKPEELTS